MARDKPALLHKQLTVFDVFVISTGAMFSSGFFLLPGIAVDITGPSVVLAYFLASLLILPAMLSQAELSTAMPRAGGTYYFLDRTMGPVVGTIGGVGTWLALVLKSAFALIGMGAYLDIFFDLPVKPLAIGFTLLLALLNIVGAKESSSIMRVLIFSLLFVMTLFITFGLSDILARDVTEIHRTNFEPFFKNGVDGLLATVGLVFVSYIGLTKVASVAEEIQNPDRDVPRGMALALVVVGVIYTVGVYIMVASLGPAALGRSLTPVADAATAFLAWLPQRTVQIIIVAAAIAAFVSMANAGVLAASRYPLAMARDGLIPDSLSRIGRFGTPTRSVLLTAVTLIAALLVLDVVAVAKLAGSLQLLLFAFINLSVIVMRESRIEAYDPGYRSPLYPWVQLAGVIFPVLLIFEMGWLPIIFTLGVVTASLLWYNSYSRGRITRDGAIYHVFERLGRRRFVGLDHELRDLMKEKGLRAGDPFDEVVARALVLDHPGEEFLNDLILEASRRLTDRLPVAPDELAEGFKAGLDVGVAPVSHGAILLHTRLPDLDNSEMLIARVSEGVVLDASHDEIRRRSKGGRIQAVFFLVSGEADPGQHLRILAQIAAHVEADDFMPEWLADAHELDLKETLLRDERFLSLRISRGTATEKLIGSELRELGMPAGCLIALIQRGDTTLIPRGTTALLESDRLTIIGEPDGLAQLKKEYGTRHHRAAAD